MKKDLVIVIGNVVQEHYEPKFTTEGKPDGHARKVNVQTNHSAAKHLQDVTGLEARAVQNVADIPMQDFERAAFIAVDAKVVGRGLSNDPKHVVNRMGMQHQYEGPTFVRAVRASDTDFRNVPIALMETMRMPNSSNPAFYVLEDMKPDAIRTAIAAYQAAPGMPFSKDLADLQQRAAKAQGSAAGLPS